MLTQYPLPNAEELIDEFSGSQSFSTSYLAGGYRQIVLDLVGRAKHRLLFMVKDRFT